MFNANAETIFIVGAGFSNHGGLPLAGKFRKTILEAAESDGQEWPRVTDGTVLLISGARSPMQQREKAKFQVPTA